MPSGLRPRGQEHRRGVDVDHGVESLGIPAAAARTVIRVASRLRIVPPAHLAGRIDPPVLTGGLFGGGAQ